MFKPLNCNVLIKPDEVDGKIGNILLADSTVSAQKHMQTMGTVVALATDAFMDADGETVEGAPVVGSRVAYGKYAAKEFDKDEGLMIVKDVDITGVAVND